MPQDELEYYRGRATQERENALSAERQDVAGIHLELARLYDALIKEPALRPTLKIVIDKRLSKENAA